MSTFIREKDRTPSTNIRSAMTATESGRRRARRTIHIGREALGSRARFYARKAFRSRDKDRAAFQTWQVSIPKGVKATLRTENDPLMKLRFVDFRRGAIRPDGLRVMLGRAAQRRPERGSPSPSAGGAKYRASGIASRKNVLPKTNERITVCRLAARALPPAGGQKSCCALVPELEGSASLLDSIAKGPSECGLV